MRTSLASALLTLPLLLVTACGPTKPVRTASPAEPAAAKISTKAACDDILKAIDDRMGKYAEQLTALAPAAGGGDPAARQRTVDTMRGIAGELSATLRGQVGRTGDAELDGILKRFSKELDRVAAGLRTHADLADGSSLDTPELNAVSAALDEKCPA